MAVRFDHIAINVDNIADAATWYKHNMSAEVLYLDDTWAMLHVGGIKLALTISSEHPPHIAFKVDACDEMDEDVKIHRDGSHYVYKADPHGNVIELIKYQQRIELK